MMLISPLMSLYIAFQVPAGVGIYWIISNLLMLLQSVVLNKFYNPKEMAAKARQEAEERREKERQERIEAKKKARDGDAEAKAKQILRKKSIVRNWHRQESRMPKNTVTFILKLPMTIWNNVAIFH